MDSILLILLFLIAGILLWAFLSGGREPSAEIPASSERPVRDALPRPDDENESAAERAFRRRAGDREIEEKLDGSAPGPSRRKEDHITDLDEAMKDGFRLPYSADQIISDSSRFRIYKRTLQNAEVYAEKGDFNTSISLFEGVGSRINDEKTLHMIEADIDYLKNYSHKKEQEAEESAAETAVKGLSKSGAGLRFTIDGPIPDSINIGVLDPNRNIDPKKIADRVAGEIREELTELTEAMRTVRSAAGLTGGDQQSSMRSEISSLRNEIESLRGDRASGLSDYDAGSSRLTGDAVEQLKREINGISGLKESLRDLHDIRRRIGDAASMGGIPDISSIKRELGEISDLRREMGDLNRKISDIVSKDRGMQVPEGTSPIVIDMSKSGPLPLTIDTKPFADLFSSIPDGISSAMKGLAGIADSVKTISEAAASMPAASAPLTRDQPAAAMRPMPAASEMYAQSLPGSASSEKVTEKVREGDEDDSFELISEYGKDRTGDNVSDEDIFEKILKEDSSSEDEKNFEILGDSRDESSGESGIIDGAYEQRRRDNEAFYRNLLKSDRRKKKELPILKVSYDFTRLPDEFGLSREQNILEYSFYKYKPMLEKAAEYIKMRKVRDAINYYKVIMGQNIPPEFKAMIRRNISDLTEYLEKYLTSD
jgi:hypothetical protein